MTDMLTVYTTPDCPSCRTAKKRLTAEGIPFQEVDLSIDEEALARLKRNNQTQAPVFGYNGTLRNIAGLRDIINEYKEAHA